MKRKQLRAKMKAQQQNKDESISIVIDKEHDDNNNNNNKNSHQAAVSFSPYTEYRQPTDYETHPHYKPRSK